MDSFWEFRSFFEVSKKLATYFLSLCILTFPHCKRYSRGGDKEERITQGLKVLFEKMDPGGLVFIFTEAPTKNLELAEALIKTKIRWNGNHISIICHPPRKHLTVTTIHPPKYEGQCEDQSWIFYHKLGQVGLIIPFVGKFPTSNSAVFCRHWKLQKMHYLLLEASLMDN